MTRWIASHVLAFVSAVRRLTRHPVATLFEVSVLGIALALPLVLFFAVEGLRSFAGRHPTEPEISVFLKTTADAGAIEAVRRRLDQLEAVQTAGFISRQEAFELLRRSPALAPVLDALPKNPLPDAFTVRSRDPSPTALAALQADIGRWPEVALVQVDSVWASRLDSIARVGRGVVIGLATLLGLAAVAVTFNTVRLQLLDRQAEIALMRLIGGTRSYIRRPFLYFGGLQGLLGGAAALGLVAAVRFAINPAITDFSSAYGTAFELPATSAPFLLSFLGFTALLGTSAALIATHRVRWAR